MVQSDGPEADREQTWARVAELRWLHRIELGDGIITPGSGPSPERVARMGIPEDLTGMTVLDVGAWDGFYSFLAERRGAERVVAVDSFSWGGEGWGTKAGFELARRTLNSNVQDREIEVLDLAPETVGVFDLVLFLGVLYHMRHPLLALERVASVTGKQLIVETETDLHGLRRPAMAFYPGTEMTRDATNWWAPNPRAIVAMLRNVGFRRVEVVWSYSLPHRIARAAGRRIRTGDRLGAGVRQSRMVVHAFR
jgi:tRNA (mo5U34)-methyltransferase